MQDRLESKKREKETNQVTLRSYWPYFVQVHHVQVDLPPLLMEHQLEGFHVLREILYRKCPDRCPPSWKQLL